MACVYPSLFGQAFSYTHALPLVIPLALWIFSIRWDSKGNWGFECIINLYSWILTWGYFIILILKGSFQVSRPDPYCPDQMGMVYPSVTAFYIGSIVTFIILLTYLWNIPLSEGYWVVVIGISGTLFLVLVRSTYNTLYEVLLSSLIGLVFTTVFLIYFRFFSPDLDIIVKQRPWCWFSLVNTWKKEN